MKKTILIFIGFFLLTSCAPDESLYKSDIPATRVPFEERVAEADGSAIKFDVGQEPTMPSAINLDVPFFSQAPDEDWGMPWQEACEEAALLLAYYYVTDQPLTKEQFKIDILNLVNWQNENFGSYEHTDVNQTAKMLERHLDYSNFNILASPTVRYMKEQLAQGKVIVAPFAGRQLGNPFYSGEGPLYHMMVIKGYDENNFITNDVGTKRGHNFIYPYETIMSAMHEWHDEDINLGEKKVIVMY